MQEVSFDTLLSRADKAARDGRWQETFDFLSQAVEIDSDHPGVITGIGTCLIQLGRPQDAVSYFHHAVDLAHESPEAHNNLGVAFSLTSELEAAEIAYLEALSLDPEHAQAWKNLAQLYLQMEDRLQEGIQLLAAVVQANPEDVETLQLLAECYEAGEEFQSAIDLYNQVLHVQPKNDQAKASLSRLKIVSSPRDASRIARPEHAQKLASLKAMEILTATEIESDFSEEGKNITSSDDQPHTVLFIPDEASLEFRFGFSKKIFAEHSFKIKHSINFTDREMEDCSVLIFSEPHQDPGNLSILRNGAQLGKKIVLDLELDFFNLPSEHPKYTVSGPGNAQSLDDLDEAISLADLVTVPSSALAERYRDKARLIEVIRPSWSNENPLWEKALPSRATLNVGLMATHGTRDDIATLKRDVARFIRETPEAILVAGGDPAIFRHFSTIPDEKRMFLPIGSVQDYPFTLAAMDILLVPFRINPLNKLISDRPLLEAGIRGIPWIAPPLPAFKEWGVGGIYVEKPGAWYTALQQLFKYPEMGTELGKEGRAKAEKRESRFEVMTWVRVLENLN